MDLFELLGKVRIDAGDAQQELDNISNKGQQTESKLSKFFSGVGKVAAGVGKAVGVGLAAARTAMGALTVKVLNLSGELEQNMGGSEAVFAEHADKIQAKAKEAFSNMGLSTSDYLATANKMGALFQGAGFSIEESMNISSDAMQRAADVASIMGIDTSSAMEAIAGAAKGNFTMMDNLGVAMNDTTLQAYALEKGINKSTSEMTNQEKIGLAMEMFMEKTAYAAGNYAKENETLAGSLGTAKAALTNFLDGSGDIGQLVDAFSNAANVIIKNISEIAPRLVSGITDLVNQVMPMLPPLLNQLLPVIVEGAVSLVNGLVDALPGIVSVIEQALPGLVEGFVQIIVNLLPALVQMLVAALQTGLPALIEGLIQLIVSICNNFTQIIQPLIDALPTIVINVVNALMENLPALIDGLITLVLGIVEAIPQIIQGLVDALPQVISAIVEGLLSCLPDLIMGLIQLVLGVAKAAGQIWQSFNEACVNVFVGIWNGITQVFAKLGDWFGEKFSGAKEKIMQAWSNVKDWFANVWNGIKNAFSNVGSWFKNIFSSAKDGIVNAFSNIKEKLSAPFEKARDLIKNVADKIKGFFKGEISMPKIKLPKFGITPSGWKIGDLLKGSIPKLSITWHADAMKNPIIMKEPTLFGYNPATGNFHGGGEVPGGEVVSGASTLMTMIESAVETKNSGIMMLLNRIIDLLVQFFPNALDALMNQVMVLDDGTLVARMAPAMDVELGKIAIKKGRGR